LITTGDFPAAEDLYLIQGIERYGAAAATGGIELGIIIGIQWS
jgi:hypothetical protein